MAEVVLRLGKTPFLLLLVVLSGCGLGDPHLTVLRGNFSFERGEFQDSIVRYLEALESDTDNASYVLYNLGTVYHAVAENEAAVEAWERAAAQAPPDVLFALHHNRGNLYYRQGRYTEAYEQFRRALLLNPSSMRSKINLELALQRIQAAESAPTNRTGGAGGNGAVSDEARRVLEYMRRKETGEWQATDTQEPRSVERYW